MRKLATIQKIKEVRPIEGADAIEHYRVLGWWVVGKKGEFKVGDLVVYIEIDSWIPHELAPFLSKGREPREYNGVKGERLRTVKLRGAVSQGLLLPVQEVEGTPFITGYFLDDGIGTMVIIAEGDEVTEALGIQKWEAPIPAQMSGKMVGYFPNWANKTDQERCQNIWDDIEQRLDEPFEVTTKLDGSSASYGISPEGDYVVCSRNISLKTRQEDNTFVDVGKALDIEQKMRDVLKTPIMISGELCGEGIQGNKEKIKGHRFFVFDIFLPSANKYLDPQARKQVCDSIGLEHVPVLEEKITLRELGIISLEDLLAYADGPSLNAKSREGVVFKSHVENFSFKAISNKWLLKNE